MIGASTEVHFTDLANTLNTAWLAIRGLGIGCFCIMTLLTVAWAIDVAKSLVREVRETGK